MRRVDNPATLRDSLEAAQREADAAFGDPTLYLEQAVINPRHIEVQVLADAAGTVFHLYERDCSLQRRHQKLIEEAPSPALDDELRRAMGVAAIKAVKAARSPVAARASMLCSAHTRAA